MYLPGTMVGIPVSLPCTTLYHPGYTSILPSNVRTISVVQGVVRCAGEEVLGSKKEKPVGGRPLSVFKS